jgi:hypothetical protein
MRDAILERLGRGESLSAICRDADMPSRETVRLWQKDDAEFDLAVTRAREDGFELRAEEALLAAKTADDAAKGRLAFDAERWFLGKLSNAFSDNKAQKHEHNVRVETVKRVIHDPRNTDSADIQPAS